MKSEKSIQKVLEETVFILNEIRNGKIKGMEKLKLTPAQEKILVSIEKDLNICVTKLGLLLHSTEL